MARSYIAFDIHCSSTDMAVVNVACKLILTQQAADSDASPVPRCKTKQRGWCGVSLDNRLPIGATRSGGGEGGRLVAFGVSAGLTQIELHGSFAR